MAAHKIPAENGSFSIISLLSVLCIQYEQRNALVMMYIFFTGLILGLVAALEPGLPEIALNVVPESDDDRLNQALLLVDILKSEYLKLLRERSGAATDTSTVEQSTCTATGSPTGESILTEKQNNQMPVSGPNTLPNTPIGQPHYPALAYTAGPPYQWGWPAPRTTIPSRRFFDVMPQPAPPVYPNPFSYRRRMMRRNLPDYSYYYGPYRRNDYYDENHEETATVGTPSTVSAKTAAAPQRKSARKVNQLVPGSKRRFNKHLRRSNYQNPPKSSGTGTSNIAAANKNNKNATPSKATAIATSEITTSPTPSGTSSATTTPSKTSDVTTVASSAARKKKLHGVKSKVETSTSMAKWPAFLFKSSMRIFLERSTPLPIPLPENNAFCFTNPKNPLCRSP